MTDPETEVSHPSSAVFQTGTHSLVFLYEGRGYLEPKQVTLGPQVGNYYAVLKGLKPQQRIVTSANFLIDSESQLQSAAGSFAPLPSSENNSPSSNASVTGKIDFTTNPTPPQKGQNVFRVRLTAAKGAAISGAHITVTFYMAAMPAMGMAAMKTSIVLNDKGNGIYEATGSLGSSGTWQVTVVAQKNSQTVATKQLSLTASGGM